MKQTLVLKPSSRRMDFGSVMNPEFRRKGEIWTKSDRLPQGVPANDETRFVFYKIGKTFGLFTKRFLGIRGQFLIYYQNENDNEVKGYCNFRNLYLTFYRSEEKYPWVVNFSNGSNEVDLYFSDYIQVNRLRNFIGKYVIQLNFETQFEVVQKIGEGSFSEVHLAKKHENGNQYAVKIVSKFDKNKNNCREAVDQEKMALQLLQSQYICRMLEFYEGKDTFVFVLEYVPGRNLMNIIKDNVFMSLETKQTILKGILSALNYAHRKGVIHRDLKPQNIIVNMVTERPKLIDLGLSLIVQPNMEVKMYKRCGTMGYIAPEVMSNNAQNRKPYTPKIDLFSFGIIAHVLLLGFNPLKGKNYEQTFLNNKTCNFTLDKAAIIKRYGVRCYNFLCSLLELDPKNRVDAEQALNDPFLSMKYKQEYKTMSTEKDIDSGDHKKEIMRNKSVTAITGQVQNKFYTSPLVQESAKVLSQIPNNSQQQDEPEEFDDVQLEVSANDVKNMPDFKNYCVKKAW